MAMLHELSEMTEFISESLCKADQNIARKVLKDGMLDLFLSSVNGYLHVGFNEEGKAFQEIRRSFLSVFANVVNISDNQEEFGFEAIIRSIGQQEFTDHIFSWCRIPLSEENIDEIMLCSKLIGTLSGFDDPKIIKQLVKIGQDDILAVYINNLNKIRDIT